MAAAPRERELLDAIHANPDDDDLRRVYGDLLAERGDPRGEFIQLQFLDDKTEEQRARERELFRRHAREWIAPLGDGVQTTDVVFARGFLDRLTVRRAWREPDPLIGNQHLSTVRALYFYGSSGGEFNLRRRPTARHPAAQLLTDPTARHLREVHCVGLLDVAIELADSPRPLAIEHLGIFERVATRAELPAEHVALLVAAAGLPRLRRLDCATHCPPETRRWLTGGPLAERLDDLTLHVASSRYASWIDAVEKHSPIPRLRFGGGWGDGFERKGWRLTVDRAATGRFESLTAERAPGLDPDEPRRRADDLEALIHFTGRPWRRIAVDIPRDDELARVLAAIPEVTFA